MMSGGVLSSEYSAGVEHGRAVKDLWELSVDSWKHPFSMAKDDSEYAFWMGAYDGAAAPAGR